VLSNERNTEESVEAGFEGFKKGLRWMVLRNKLVERFGLEVTNQEVRQAMAQQVAGYFGGQMQPWMTEEFIDSMVDRMLKEKGASEEKYEALMNEKLSDALRPLFPADEQAITPEELEGIIAAINAENEESEIYFDEEE
jgi:trigger factor